MVQVKTFLLSGLFDKCWSRCKQVKYHIVSNKGGWNISLKISKDACRKHHSSYTDQILAWLPYATKMNISKVLRMANVKLHLFLFEFCHVLLGPAQCPKAGPHSSGWEPSIHDKVILILTSIWFSITGQVITLRIYISDRYSVQLMINWSSI